VVDAPDREVVDVSAGWSLLGPAAGAAIVAVAGIAVRTTVARPPRRPSKATDTPLVEGRRSTRIARRAAAAAGSLVVAFTVGPLVVGTILAAILLVRSLRPLAAARRRRATIERTLPEAMELLVLSVRAGLTPYQAVDQLASFEASAIGDACAEVVRRTQRGQAFADALAALPEQLGTRAGGLADVIATSDRHGLPLGPVLDQLSAEIRSTRRQLDQADARTLPVRLSFPLVVCTLPSFVLLAIAPALIAALSSLGATAW
jgi:tight adherence protein C